MSTFSGSPKDSPRSSPSPQPPARAKPDTLLSPSRDLSSSREHVSTPDSPTSSAPSHTPPRASGGITSSRPGSMIFQQPLMETSRDTEPELIPIFQYLNSHSNKLYQEGYFLKLNDLDTGESPSRPWTAQADKDQAVNLPSTEIGPSALLSSLEPFFHSGMQLRWIKQVRMAKSLPLSSTWRTHQSKW